MGLREELKSLSPIKDHLFSFSTFHVIFSWVVCGGLDFFNSFVVIFLLFRKFLWVYQSINLHVRFSCFLTLTQVYLAVLFHAMCTMICWECGTKWKLVRFCDVLCLMVVIEPTLHLLDWARCDESLPVFTCAVIIKVMLCVGVGIIVINCMDA